MLLSLFVNLLQFLFSFSIEKRGKSMTVSSLSFFFMVYYIAKIRSFLSLKEFSASNNTFVISLLVDVQKEPLICF